MSKDMFKDYPQPSDYTPDNRHAPCRKDCRCEDVVIVNGTSTHTFRLDFLYSESCESFEAIYNYGLGESLSISSLALGAPFSLEEHDGKTYITITLSPVLTSLFDESRDACAQLKLTLRNGSVIYGDKNRLTVRGTLG